MLREKGNTDGCHENAEAYNMLQHPGADDHCRPGIFDLLWQRHEQRS